MGAFAAFNIVMSALVAVMLFCLFMAFSAPSCPDGSVPTLSSPKMWACVQVAGR